MKTKDARYVMDVLDDVIVLVASIDKNKLDQDIYDRMTKAISILETELWNSDAEDYKLRPLNFHDPNDMMEFDGDEDE